MSEVKDEVIVDLEERALVDADTVCEHITGIIEDTFGDNVSDVNTEVTFNGPDLEEEGLMRLETVTTYRLSEESTDDTESVDE